MMANWSKGVLSGMIFLIIVSVLAGCGMPGSAETTTLAGSDKEIVVASHIAYPLFEFYRGASPGASTSS